MDYRMYRLSVREGGAAVAEAIAITVCIALLFYESLWAAVLFPAILVILWKRSIKSGKEKRLRLLAGQFSDMMRAVSAALLSGYSIENAMVEAQKEVGLLHGKNAPLVLELEEMNQSLRLGVPIEQLFSDFGKRSGVEDITDFAEVFAFAKRSGGDLVRIIATTTEHMRGKQETEQEIAVAVASRKLEQRVMDVVPLFILAYLRIGSGDYLDVMYGSLFGVSVMSACLLLYLAAILLSEKILSIRV